MHELLARKLVGGDMYLQIAKSHFEKHEWGQASRALETALRKGRLSDKDEALRYRLKIRASLGQPVFGTSLPQSDVITCSIGE